MTVGRPPATEYGPGQAGYVSRITGDVNPLDALQVQGTSVLSLLVPLDDRRASYRYAPDKWSVKQCLGHMSDAERVFAYRILRFARGDVTPLPGFDQDVFMAGSNFDAVTIDDLVADWSAVRASTLSLSRTIDAEGWLRRGTASDHPSSARTMLYVLLGHTEHHFAVLRDRYGLDGR
jgi:hypothetical protein